ncbi:MAG: phosphatase PAP2 family protein, partial [Nanoarchaeota archaeon]|nr:phosphatase PAP2 family protein [Nanoarchaeota archaeon]
EIFFLTDVSKFVDFLFEPALLVIIGTILSVYFYFNKRKKEGMVFFISLAIMSIIVEFLKFLFDRARPLNFLILREDYSFPSGHAAVTILFFGFLSYFFFKNKSARVKLISYIVAGFLILLTGFTRIYLRVHWFTDVLVGYLIGGIILAGAIVVMRKGETNLHRLI